MRDRSTRLVAGVAAALLGVGAGVASGEPLALQFAPAVNVSDAEGLSDAPVVVTDAEGRVFVAWEERPLELAVIARSDDGAATFSEPVPIVPGSPYLSFGQIELASSAADAVSTTCTAFDLFSGAAEIVYAGSTDGGQTFPDPGLLSPIDNFNSYAPDIAAGWSIAVAWGDIDVWTGITAIQVRVSTDGGVTFTEQTRADDSFGYACCPAIALSGASAMFVAWQEKIDPFLFDDAYEVMFSRSLDGGATFSAPINVSRIPQPSYPPRIATDGNGVIYVLWEEGDYLEDMKLYLAVSLDDGATFGGPQQIAGPVGDIEADFAVSADAAVWIAWVERDGMGGYAGRITRSLDAGATFATPVSLPGDCGADPRCAYTIASATRSRVFVAEAPSGVTEDVLVRSGMVVTCGDANDDGAITATDALAALSAAVGIGECEPARCDTDGSGAVTASDALAILSAAVGIPVVLACP
jgi:hypothetical protein